MMKHRSHGESPREGASESRKRKKGSRSLSPCRGWNLLCQCQLAIGREKEKGGRKGRRGKGKRREEGKDREGKRVYAGEGAQPE